MRSLAFIITEEEGFFVARCPQLDVTSQGRTLQEAQKNMKEAIECYIEAFGLEDIPETTIKPVVATVEIG
ncbi:MAG: type II toxin-antitoxin system HicB family antitoxin [Phycisphaerae bacterium]|nr:type II toxin-antitoxin system HicB family antitoxin [Phycisphaerae bacterium]